VHRLVETADIVVDNFRPGVMARFGLDAASLLARRPDLIIASSSANGADGPEATGGRTGQHLRATGGLSEQTGYPTGRRPRSVNRPTTEAAAYWPWRCSRRCCIGPEPDRANTSIWPHGRLSRPARPMPSWPSRLARRGRYGSAMDIAEYAPHGVFRAALTDDWVAIAIVNDAEWAGLCAVLQHEEWIQRYPDAAARRGADAEITDAIAAWTSQRSSRAGFELLQAAGVPAMAVLTNEALSDDPHVQARGIFVDVNHPEIGRLRVMRPPWLFSDQDFDVRPGPLIGQDNDYVLSAILGLSAQERDEILEGPALTEPGSDVRIGVVSAAMRGRRRNWRLARSTRCGSVGTCVAQSQHRGDDQPDSLGDGDRTGERRYLDPAAAPVCRRLWWPSRSPISTGSSTADCCSASVSAVSTPKNSERCRSRSKNAVAG